MRFMVRVLIVAVAATAPLACTRYEWVPDDGLITCNDSARQANGRSFTPDQDPAADSGSVRGRVILSDSRYPLPGTVVTLLTNPTQQTTTDSLGTFTFAGVKPGTYLLRTRRIGVVPRTDTLHLAHTRAVTFVLPLDAVMNDGPCSGFMIGIPKPWWKFW
jgi:hypothetical protein